MIAPFTWTNKIDIRVLDVGLDGEFPNPMVLGTTRRLVTASYLKAYFGSGLLDFTVGGGS